MTITLSTPPPSLNNCFKNVTGVGRVRTAKYKEWIEQAGWELLGQRQRRYIAGRVALAIEVEDGATRADLDNLSKPIIDLLVAHGIITDDAPEYVRAIIVGFAEDLRGLRIFVTPLS